MDESEDNMSAEDIQSVDSPLSVKLKPKKRSLVERELETNLTARVTSPVTSEGTSTSRYGRARRLKDLDAEKVIKPLRIDTSRSQPQAYKMHASNSPIRKESPKHAVSAVRSIEDQIENIYNENISLSRFGSEEQVKALSPAKKFPKVYIRKDLTQKPDTDTVALIKNIFSPVKKSNTHLNNILERSSEKYTLNGHERPQNGFPDTSSVVKTLDFDGKKKKKDVKEKTVAKNELFELEASCEYQVGDLAWARVGTYPFWPCIITREPFTELFVKKKLFGRVEREVVHVTFFGDNGRRGWIVDYLLRKYLGRAEFESAREKFTPEDKKKDPRLYAAHFVSEKKLALWNISVDEAEAMLREPKRLRIDILHDMLEQARATKTTPKREKGGKIVRTDSDVSLSESLYDTLFSEDDGKTDESNRSKKPRNKSLDVSEVVTACLDNMAAKSGIIKIQKQSHMDRWLQKAKSKTPEKIQPKFQIKSEKKKKDRLKKKSKETRKMKKNKGLSADSNLMSYQNEHDYSSVNYENHDINEGSNIKTNFEENGYDHVADNNGIEIVTKIESLSSSMEDYTQDDIITTVVSDDIVINSSVNKNIDVIDDNVTKNYEIDNSLQDISVTNPHNSISLTENEQNKTDLDSTKKKKKKIKNVVQTRRSKRKRQSIEDDSSILEDKKPDKMIKTSSNLDETTQTDISIITDISDIENMDKNPMQESVLDNEILDAVEQKSDIKEQESVTPLEVCKDTSKSRECHHNDLVHLNVKKAVVIIEPLNMSTLETLITKESHGRGEVFKSKNKLDNVKQKTLASGQPKNESDNTESLITDELDSSTSNTTVSEPTLDVTKNVANNENGSTDSNVSVDSLNAIKKIKDKETVSNEEFTIDNSHFTDEENDETEKMDVDDQNINDNNERQKNSTNLVSEDDKADLRQREVSDSKDTVTAKCDSRINSIAVEKLNTVIPNVVMDNPGFMKYLEFRQDAVKDEQPELSQDEIVTYLYQTWLYDESNKSDRKKTDDAEQLNLVKGLKSKAMLPPKKTKKKSKAEKESNSEVVPKEPSTANVVIDEEMYIFDRTLSQDYDEIAEGVCDDVNNSPIDSDTNTVLDKQLLITAEDLNITSETTFSQDYDEISEAFEKEEEVIKNQENCLSNDEDSSLKLKNITDCDKVTCDNFYMDNSKSKKKKKQLNAESICTNVINKDIPKVCSEDLLFLNKNDSKSTDQTLEENNTKPDTVEKNMETIVNNEEINKFKDKKRKSPKLSLNRTKNASGNIQVSDLQNNTESPVNIFLDSSSDRVKGLNEDLKNDLVKSDCKINTDFKKCSKPNKSIHKFNGLFESKESTPERKLGDEFDPETASMKSEDSRASLTRRKIRSKEKQDINKAMDDPEFIKYLEFRQDALIDEQPELSQDEIVTYLYQTWLYEESNKSDQKKTDDVDQSNLVKGLIQEVAPQPKKIKKKPKVEKERDSDVISKESKELDIIPKEKSKRKTTQSKPCYNEDFSDLEEEDLETFNIFDPDEKIQNENGEQIDEVELYFEKLTKPKPNVFKGIVREKVCEICDQTGNLVKCKSCHGTYHLDCVRKEEQITEVSAPTRGRKKKKKPRGRKPKGYYESLMDSGSQSDERSQDANISEELDVSIEDEAESHITVDADNFEVQWELKMKELTPEIEEEDYESGQEVYWDAPPGQCEIVDIKRKEKPIDYSDFKCNNCQKYDTPVCFVCKSNKSPKGLIEVRQKCQVAHCHRYYHLECLEYWPQTQFNSWEPSKTNKKVIEYIEALSCPRHVCHTCVSDDPRGCKTRFCGDKLARCVKCPATYHSFTKCLPAGTQILTGSQIICPRHYEHRAGQVPRHVNTGWCFICALGGTLICCEYCPTSFHAECLNIKPPEGSYMCEDCETGRLPLYGEMVWVKLGHYRWWPGIILHPCEIPENILAVKHSPGEFVVRFFGQYDHYWVNRGRVFPFQEGDSGKISSQKSKIDAAFTTAMEHAQRACEILKNVEPNEEEEEDIASSLLPPHYVKLKCNKPVGALPAPRDTADSLTQCDCEPAQPEPCGPYSHCLNRMLLTECGPLCRAGERCHNRAFEKRLYPRLAPHRTPQRGWGLRALQDIKQGQFVIEYVGELIDEEEFRRRMCRKHEVRDENFYFLTLDKERMIDAGPKGNLARFMNHCCEPNCETQKWTVLGDVRVGLFALQDIPANSEVTFNYNLECAGIEKKRCLCGAKRCSGYIGAKPKQEETQPKKLKGPGKRTYKKRKNVEDSPSTSKTKPPIKIKIVKPIKPRELTEIEKDLLIIKNATNGMSSDSEGSRLSSVDEKKDAKALKRKRVSFSTDEVSSNSSGKKLKVDECKRD